MLQVMLSLGLLVPHGDQKKLCEGLAMPAFPKLSVQRCYALTLLNLLPDNKPVPYPPFFLSSATSQSPTSCAS